MNKFGHLILFQLPESFCRFSANNSHKFRTIHIGFVAENFPLDHLVGKSYHSFGITADGTLWKSGRQRSNFARGDLSVGDIIGCVIAVGSKTATAEAVNCRRCLEKPSWLFFTKNGKIWGNSFD